jgi:hypothetical protein
MKKVILLLVVFISTFSCTNSDRNKDKAKVLDIEKTLTQFAESHNAVSKIETLIGSEGSDPFTFEIEKFINEKKDRYFLVKGTLQDIIFNKENYILQINDFLWLSPVCYRLSVNNDFVSKLISDGINKYDDIAVIANFKGVQKLGFEVSTSGEELDISASNTLIFYGECKAFMKIN